MDNEKPQAEPCACTVSVMGEIPPTDAAKFLKASKATLLVRGLIFFIFGLLMMMRPASAAVGIVIVLGVYVLFEGIAMFRSAFAMPPSMRPIWITNAVLLLILALFALISPLFLGSSVIILFGIWQLMTGLQTLLLPAARGRRGTVASGILSLLAGLFFISMPIFGLLTLSWLFAVLFFLSGIMMLTAGFMIR